MPTLTYNNEQEQPGVLNAEEQDSLQVGEELAQQEAQQYAGKFQSAEELEKAYVELQSKLGEKNNEQQQPEQPEEKQEEVVDSTILDQLWNKAINNEEVTEDFLNELNQQNPNDLAKMYLDYRQAVEGRLPQTMSDEDIAGLKGTVGGEQAYDEMLKWAGKNFSEQDINLYDSVMERGDPASCYFALQALRMRYSDSQGVDPDVLTGTAPRSQFSGFRSQAELIAAMNDERYENDPAYRQDVMMKLDKSPDLMF